MKKFEICVHGIQRADSSQWTQARYLLERGKKMSRLYFATTDIMCSDGQAIVGLASDI